jgi:RNA polymerase sigma factor (sigma-70 family)
MDRVADSVHWRDACETLYREHSARILRLGRLLLDDRHEAQDVAQEVFVKLLRAYPTADGDVRWGAWLAKVTLNACRDRRRAGWWRWGRGRGRPLETLDLADPEPGPERAATSAEITARVWEAFRRLPRRQREVAVLRYVDGCSTREVAETLGLTPGTVKRHLFRAVGRLRAALGDEP